jgi:Mg2+ and Co2+ transporter CorA
MTFTPAQAEHPPPVPAPAPGDPQTPGPAAGSVSTAIPPQCPTRTRLYRAGELLDEGFPAEQISELLAADQAAVAWLDLYEPTEADLQIVTEEFGLHPLAVEDAISQHQRPKVDRYRTHLFANMYAVSVDERGAALAAGEISVFITPACWTPSSTATTRPSSSLMTPSTTCRPTCSRRTPAWISAAAPTSWAPAWPPCAASWPRCRN